MRQPPQYIFSRSAVREVDRRAIEDYGIPGVVLMENAARGVAHHALDMLAKMKHQADPRHPRVMLIAGGGNNGGDAFAAARHLHNAGVRTFTVVLKPRDSYTGDAAANLATIDAMDLPILDAIGPASDDPLAVLEEAADPGVSLIIDGIFGTGLSGDVRPPYDAVIRWINDHGAAVLAVDIPSGLDCDTGEELGAAVRADLTATFVGFKRGFVTPRGKEIVGRVAVVDIGVPRELVAELGYAL